ncbi:hypothetical protein GUITHDRAFT_151166, partial [Guillardia theta CCMP2712]
MEKPSDEARNLQDSAHEAKLQCSESSTITGHPEDAPESEGSPSQHAGRSTEEGEDCKHAGGPATLESSQQRDVGDITLRIDEIEPGPDILEANAGKVQAPLFVNSVALEAKKKPSLFGEPSSIEPDLDPENLQTGQILQVLSLGKLRWGQDPQIFCCPYCKQEDFSANHYEHTPLSWTSAGILCAMGCWLGCCLIPFCLDNLKNVRHTCPSCGRVVGLRRACGPCQVGTHVVCCCGRD